MWTCIFILHSTTRNVLLFCSARLAGTTLPLFTNTETERAASTGVAPRLISAVVARPSTTTHAHSSIHSYIHSFFLLLSCTRLLVANSLPFFFLLFICSYIRTSFFRSVVVFSSFLLFFRSLASSCRCHTHKGKRTGGREVVQAGKGKSKTRHSRHRSCAVVVVNDRDIDVTLMRLPKLLPCAFVVLLWLLLCSI